MKRQGDPADRNMPFFCTTDLYYNTERRTFKSLVVLFKKRFPESASIRQKYTVNHEDRFSTKIGSVSGK